MIHVRERLAALVLGELDDDEREAVLAHLGSCRACAREHRELDETFALAGGALEPLAPSPAARARLLEALPAPRTAARWAGFLERLAALFDMSAERVRQLLDGLDAPDAWKEGPVRGSWYVSCEGGPRTDGAFVGFVKLGPGVRWPRHRHLGRELMLVLAGGFRQPDGFEVHAGGSCDMAEGTAHGFRAFADEPCIAASVAWNGVAFEPGSDGED